MYHVQIRVLRRNEENVPQHQHEHRDGVVQKPQHEDIVHTVDPVEAIDPVVVWLTLMRFLIEVILSLKFQGSQMLRMWFLIEVILFFKFQGRQMLRMWFS